MNSNVVYGQGEHLSKPFKAIDLIRALHLWLQDFTFGYVLFSFFWAGFRGLKESLQKAFRAVHPALHNTFYATGV